MTALIHHHSDKIGKAMIACAAHAKFHSLHCALVPFVRRNNMMVHAKQHTSHPGHRPQCCLYRAKQ